MTTFFVSDVHLSGSREKAIDAFLSFLDSEIRGASALYILGDLFDLWLGDDDTRFPHLFVLDALRRVTARGISVGVLHGNHDFLLGAGFEKRTGCRLLPDPYFVNLDGKNVLLSHGDILCTDDVAYQEYRRRIHSPEQQDIFLSLPMKQRLMKAAFIQGASQEAVQSKSAHIMDVNKEAVEEMMLHHNVHYLIHGHTHRPGTHGVSLEGRPGTRIVLGDWYEQGKDNVLIWKKDSFRLVSVYK
uniref:UDP-2,3-diacylglucosamine hydrolase n=1 Tax=Candidatus Kentrum sp. FM TaxID=2126340 RepID=A0A450WN53_9GAMM|nr:MAG: UDP-2,3-diacylglucosamine hydrolase [Candidatus Kentron sp. FM]VFJ58794.1 MAG: UDP-2,3-diacylglucosamine hydrolase [Candidatus Kentron sp. FM]VFK18476.1 MAG: UDP-2,3-diacylglucosamine hydrolase [Candidatus Kentron sp. FM]